MVRSYLRVVSNRAARQAWCAVIANSWSAWLTKVASTSLLLFLAYVFVSRTVANDSALFSDQATMVALAVLSAVILAFGVFFLQLLFVAPYQLWKEEKERADQLLSTDAGRLVAVCTADGVLDYDKLREPMAALIDPNREYNEEWERLRLEEEVAKARQIATAEEEARLRVQERARFEGRLRNLAPADTTARKPPKRIDMPFCEVFRYVAFDSKWAESYDRFTDPDPGCRKDGDYALAKEIREALAREDVNARGRRCLDGSDRDYGAASMPIRHDYWTNAYMQPFGEIIEADANRCVATTKVPGTDRKERYRQITLSRDEVLAKWPRQRTTRLGPPRPTQFARDLVEYVRAITRGRDDE
jgi:hypothetical protein